jgi:hypothetical protein
MCTHASHFYAIFTPQGHLSSPNLRPKKYASCTELTGEKSGHRIFAGYRPALAHHHMAGHRV